MNDGEISQIDWAELGRPAVNQTSRRLTDGYEIDDSFATELNDPSVELWEPMRQMLELKKRFQSDTNLQEWGQMIRINPYSPAALELTRTLATELGKDEKIVRSAAIFAEPEAAYDQEFRQQCVAEKVTLQDKFAHFGFPLPEKQQMELTRQLRALRQKQRSNKENKYFGEIDQAADITVSLVDFVREQMDSLDEVPDEALFEQLMHVATGGKSEAEMEQNLSQQQRSSLRLAITHFIEARREVVEVRTQLPDDPKQLVEQLFKIQIQHQPTIQWLPIGLVIRLEKTDYDVVEQKNNQKIPTLGLFFPSSDSEALAGKIIVLNQGQKQSQKISDQVETHEFNHLLFHNFFSTKSTDSNADFQNRLTKAKSVTEYKMLADWLNSSWSQRGQDELISYAIMNRSGWVHETSIGADKWEEFFVSFDNSLYLNETLTIEQKREAHQYFAETYQKYMASMQNYFQLVDAMMLAGKLHVRGLDQEKVRALLVNTAINKTQRLKDRYLPGMGGDLLTEAAVTIRLHDVKSLIRINPTLLKSRDFETDIPWEVKVRDLFRGTDRNQPTLEQVKQLVELLPAHDEAAWAKFFTNPDGYAIPIDMEGIPVFMRIMEKGGTTVIASTVKRIDYLMGRKSPDLPQPIRKQLLATIEKGIAAQPDQKTMNLQETTTCLEKLRFRFKLQDLIKAIDPQNPSLATIIDFVHQLPTTNTEIWEIMDEQPIYNLPKTNDKLSLAVHILENGGIRFVGLVLDWARSVATARKQPIPKELQQQVIASIEKVIAAQPDPASDSVSRARIYLREIRRLFTD